ncbi:MAG: hypothetical protein JWL90_1223 [Chthoniobacteraceae bacterium]|nr:hypothetical protein [Chthoniobacteraceae bacterium]
MASGHVKHGSFIETRGRICPYEDLRCFPLLSLFFSPALEPDPGPTFSRVELKDLFHIAEHQEEVAWEAFKDGVDIHRLYGDGVSGPTAALLLFREAGKVPLHTHGGYEHILILAGSQRDNNSTATAGTLMINPPGPSTA